MDGSAKETVSKSWCSGEAPCEGPRGAREREGARFVDLGCRPACPRHERKSVGSPHLLFFAGAGEPKKPPPLLPLALPPPPPLLRGIVLFVLSLPSPASVRLVAFRSVRGHSATAIPTENLLNHDDVARPRMEAIGGDKVGTRGGSHGKRGGGKCRERVARAFAQ